MPNLSPKAPEPPAHLSPAACELWKALVADWEFHGAERLVLKNGLEAGDIAERARRELAALQSLTLETGAGMSRVHPLVKVYLDASKECRMAFQSLKLEAAENVAETWRARVAAGNR
jgi:phage terminase small subunit